MNLYFSYTFGIYLILWTAVNLYSLIVGKIDHTITNFYEHLSSHGKEICFAFLGSIILTVLLVYALKFFSRSFVYFVKITIYVVPVTVVLTVIGIIIYSTSGSISLFAYLLMVILLLSIAIPTLAFGTGFISCNVAETSKIIKDSCRAIIFYPYSILISVFAHIQILVIIILFVTVADCLTNPQMKNEHSTFFLAILHILNVLGSMWILFFILDFQHIIINSIAITWYATEDKKQLRRANISKAIYETIRAHFGTVVFGSSLLPILLQKITSIYRTRDKHILLNLYMLVDPRYFTRNIYTVAVLENIDYLKSIDKAFYYLLSNKRKIIYITKIVMLLTILLNIAVSSLLALIFIHVFKSYTEGIAVGLILYFPYSMFSTLYLIASSMLLCQMKENTPDNVSSDKKGDDVTIFMSVIE